MTLDEAIKHCKEKAKELSDKAYHEWGKSMTEQEAYDCNECAREHEQLSKWLEDYKRLLEERPQGKWLFDSAYTVFGNPYGTYKCSCCGGHSSGRYPYCFWCGTKMKGGAE